MISANHICPHRPSTCHAADTESLSVSSCSHVAAVAQDTTFPPSSPPPNKGLSVCVCMGTCFYFPMLMQCCTLPSVPDTVER